MRINTVKIENYRCFNKFEVEFAEKTTVLIGKNGTGKTSLISALKKGMSFMFAKSHVAKKTLNQSSSSNVRAFSLWDSRFDEMERNFCFPIQIVFSGIFNKQVLKWTFYKKQDPGSLYLTLYRDALNEVLKHYNNKKSINNQMPVLAYFSDSYPHIMSNVGSMAGKIAKMDILPRDFGYYGWDEETNCAELWQRRYIKVANRIRDFEDIKKEIENIEAQIVLIKVQINNKVEFDKHKTPERENKIEYLKEKLERLKATTALDTFVDEFIREKDFVENRVFMFTKPLRDEMNFINKEFQINRISVNRPDRKSYSMEFSFNDGKSMHFEMLPQGYKRLFSMVFDIAYRSYIINEGKESGGIVFIDEIELHLHPTLQQEVLDRLRKTFPEIQFIVSTHSPLVLSNLMADGEQNKIIKLENDGSNYTKTTLENIYGIDYTTGLMDIMGSKYRASSIDNLIDSIVILSTRNRQDDAEKVRKELFSMVGENNSYIQKEIDNRIEMNRKK